MNGENETARVARRQAIEFILDRPEILEKQLQELFLKHDELMTEATHITQVIRPVVGGSGEAHGKIEPLVLQMLTVNEKMNQVARKWLDAKEERADMIVSIQDPLLRAVVTSRYVYKKSIGTIAKENGIRKETVRKAIKKALNQIDLQEGEENNG